MSFGDVLKWSERTLLTAGVVLGAWWVGTVIEARYFRSLPLPPPASIHDARLPGEEPADSSRRAPKRTVLERGGWLARLDAPTVQLSATVLEGTDDATLARGAGHIEDTAFPGDTGNLGIAGHRDTVFRPVRSLKIGDPLRL